MGIAERKERERERRRNEIIDAAERVFFKHGFENASVESVANEAELSKATLYLYFKSKEELHFAICMRGQRILFSMFDETLEDPKLSLDNIRAFLKTIVRFQKEYPDYFQALFYFQINQIKLDEENEDVKLNREMDQEYMKKWINLIEQGKSQGVLRETLNPLTTVLLIWIQLTGLLKSWSENHEQISRDFNVTEEELLNDYYDLVFDGILKK